MLQCKSCLCTLQYVTVTTLESDIVKALKKNSKWNWWAISRDTKVVARYNNLITAQPIMLLSLQVIQVCICSSTAQMRQIPLKHVSLFDQRSNRRSSLRWNLVWTIQSNEQHRNVKRQARSYVQILNHMYRDCGGWASHSRSKCTVVFFSVFLYSFRPLFVNCMIVLTVCLILAWLLSLTTYKWTLTTEFAAAWRVQKPSWWPGKVIYSVRLIGLRRDSCSVLPSFH